MVISIKYKTFMRYQSLRLTVHPFETVRTSEPVEKPRGKNLNNISNLYVLTWVKFAHKEKSFARIIFHILSPVYDV